MIMSLTETAFQTRRAIKFGLIFIVALITLNITWAVGYKIYRRVFPAPPPPPEVRFNKLPALVFDLKPALPALTYTLQTPTGDLPNFPVQINVFFMPTPQSSFLNLDDANRVARSLNFSTPGTSLTEVIYRYTHPEVPETLDINIVNKTLSLSYNLAQDSSLLSLHPKSNEGTLAATRSFLNRASLLASDLDQGKQTFEYLKTAPDALQTVSSLSAANFIRVNLWRRNYDDLPIITPRIDRSNVWFLVSGSDSTPKQIIAGEYHYFAVNESQKSTYPIKTDTTAWDELQGGTGQIISAPASSNQVVVRRVYLGYYDSGKVQQFLEPVVVFDGDNGFRAIVPAVTDQWYGTQ